MHTILQEAIQKAQQKEFKEAQRLYASVIAARESEDFMLITALQGMGDVLCRCVSTTNLLTTSEGKFTEAVKVYDQLLALTKIPSAYYNKVLCLPKSTNMKKGLCFD